ncbi:MAG: YlxR family protein [Myxococcales bacterium]|nr:YlxR family protein [Myxococcales bacterium]
MTETAARPEPTKTTRARTRDSQRGGRPHARTCVGCGTRASSSESQLEIVRIAFVPASDGALGCVVDIGRRGVGRGAWLHPRRACIENAARHGLARAARARVVVDAAGLFDAVGDAAETFARHLVSVGLRAKKAVVGTTAVENAGDAVLLLLCAADAAAVEHPAVVRKLASGQARVLGNKESLGALSGREAVGLIGITDQPLAEAISQAIAVSQSSRERGETSAIVRV